MILLYKMKEIRMRHTEKLLIFLVWRIERSIESAGNFICIGLGGKSCNVLPSPGNSISNLIK